MRSDTIENEMSQTQASPTQAAAKTSKIATEPSPDAKIDGAAQELRESRKTLSENEEWLQKNSGKLVSK
jgi:hypothetical protein